MNFSIKCQTFARLANICHFFEPSTRQDIIQKINTLRIENKNGKSFAVATNEKIAVAEFLHTTEQPDGYVHVVLHPELIKQCEIEMQYDSNLHFTVIQEIAVATATTDLGYTFPSNACYWFEDSPLNDWRNWFPEMQLAESQGAMYWNANHLETLVKSSPSGQIAFPEFINTSNPVLLRDIKSPNWVGVFIPENTVGQITKAAILPDWWEHEA